MNYVATKCTIGNDDIVQV